MSKLKNIRKIKGANIDIDFVPAKWEKGECPWEPKHKCAVKNTSICKYFEGVEKLDVVLCSYPRKSKSWNASKKKFKKLSLHLSRLSEKRDLL